MSSQRAPTRTLPPKPSLAQLRKQAKDLFKAYRASNDQAVAEISFFEERPDPANFTLTDAQRVLARAYGFSSWSALKDHVDGINLKALIAAVDAGDAVNARRLAKARPDLIDQQIDFRGGALHCAVVNRNEQMTRVLMELGANARVGIWPHRDATSPYAIAVDREYTEIVAVIEREEDNRRSRLSHGVTPTSTETDTLWQAIIEGRSADAIALIEADPALIGSCDVYGVTPLHIAAWKHDPALVGWLLGHGASPLAEAQRSVPVRVPADEYPVESGKTPLDFAAFVAGQAPDRPDTIFYFMERARTDPALFQETARLLIQKGAQLTPRAAVALGDREAAQQMHREGRLHNEIHFVRGGLLSVAVRVNRPEMVSLLLDLGLDPDESVPTEDGFRSWGMPLWFASMCDRYEIAELLLARGADVNGVVFACGDSICAAEAEPMHALLRKHGARLTVETVTDPKVAQAILDGTVTAYTLGDPQPINPQDAPELLFGRSDPEFVRICLPHIRRKSDDPWWNDVLRTATSPEALRLILDHGVDPNVSDGGGCTTLHHLASGSWKWSENLVVRAAMLLDAGASLTLRDRLLKSTPLGWACRWGRIELVTLFLERGADAVEPDAEPWANPFAWARKREHHEIAALLRSP